MCDTQRMEALVLDRTVNHVRIDEHWVLVRIPLARPIALPPLGDLNTSEAVGALYG